MTTEARSFNGSLVTDNVDMETGQMGSNFEQKPNSHKAETLYEHITSANEEDSSDDEWKSPKKTVKTNKMPHKRRYKRLSEYVDDGF